VARLSLHEGKVTQQWLDNDHVLDAIGIGLHWVHR
jgi:hypothetical protein